METLDLLKLDMANFTITQMRPQIQQQVVGYEQQKFKEFLELQKGFFNIYSILIFNVHLL
jgi:hypothetical protein